MGQVKQYVDTIIAQVIGYKRLAFARSEKSWPQQHARILVNSLERRDLKRDAGKMEEVDPKDKRRRTDLAAFDGMPPPKALGLGEVSQRAFKGMPSREDLGGASPKRSPVPQDSLASPERDPVSQSDPSPFQSPVVTVSKPSFISPSGVDAGILAECSPAGKKEQAPTPNSRARRGVRTLVAGHPTGTQEPYGPVNKYVSRKIRRRSRLLPDELGERHRPVAAKYVKASETFSERMEADSRVISDIDEYPRGARQRLHQFRLGQRVATRPFNGIGEDEYGDPFQVDPDHVYTRSTETMTQKPFRVMLGTLSRHFERKSDVYLIHDPELVRRHLIDQPVRDIADTFSRREGETVDSYLKECKDRYGMRTDKAYVVFLEIKGIHIMVDLNSTHLRKKVFTQKGYSPRPFVQVKINCSAHVQSFNAYNAGHYVDLQEQGYRFNEIERSDASPSGKQRKIDENIQVLMHIYYLSNQLLVHGEVENREITVKKKIMERMLSVVFNQLNEMKEKNKTIDQGILGIVKDHVFEIETLLEQCIYPVLEGERDYNYSEFRRNAEQVIERLFYLMTLTNLNEDGDQAWLSKCMPEIGSIETSCYVMPNGITAFTSVLEAAVEKMKSGKGTVKVSLKRDEYFEQKMIGIHSYKSRRGVQLDTNGTMSSKEIDVLSCPFIPNNSPSKTQMKNDVVEEIKSCLTSRDKEKRSPLVVIVDITTHGKCDDLSKSIFDSGTLRKELRDGHLVVALVGSLTKLETAGLDALSGGVVAVYGKGEVAAAIKASADSSKLDEESLSAYWYKMWNTQIDPDRQIFNENLARMRDACQYMQAELSSLEFLKFLKTHRKFPTQPIHLDGIWRRLRIDGDDHRDHVQREPYAKFIEFYIVLKMKQAGVPISTRSSFGLGRNMNCTLDSIRFEAQRNAANSRDDTDLQTICQVFREVDSDIDQWLKGASSKFREFIDIAKGIDLEKQVFEDVGGTTENFQAFLDYCYRSFSPGYSPPLFKSPAPPQTSAAPRTTNETPGSNISSIKGRVPRKLMSTPDDGGPRSRHRDRSRSRSRSRDRHRRRHR